MAIKRRSRESVNADDVAWFAAFIGDECPPDFNPFRFLLFQDALIFHGRRDGETYALDARDAWQRLGPQVLAEWRRRRHRALPPGAVLDLPKRDHETVKPARRR